MKTFDELFAELTDKAATRPAGSGTVAALDAGVHTLGKKIIEEAGEVWLAAEHESDDSLAEATAALERIDPSKDADGLHPTNLGWLVLGKPAPLPCTPMGCIELLRRHDVPIAGARVAVVGRGITVGRPLGLILTRRSENATVVLCHTGTRDLAAETRRADVIVAAAGVAHMLTPDMVKPGAAVLDVGVSRVEGKVAGDVAKDVTEVAGFVSPNPGGVGPMTRTFLVRNIVENAERQAGVGQPDGTFPRIRSAFVIDRSTPYRPS